MQFLAFACGVRRISRAQLSLLAVAFYALLKNLTVIQTRTRAFTGLLKGIRGIKENLQEGGSGE